MAHKQLFVIVMLISFVSLATAQSEGGACGANTVPNNDSNNCGTACPITCRNRNNPPQFCTTQCITSGCSCANGFIRSTDSKSECICPSQCPN